MIRCASASGPRQRSPSTCISALAGCTRIDSVPERDESAVDDGGGGPAGTPGGGTRCGVRCGGGDGGDGGAPPWGGAGGGGGGGGGGCVWPPAGRGGPVRG